VLKGLFHSSIQFSPLKKSLTIFITTLLDSLCGILTSLDLFIKGVMKFWRGHIALLFVISSFFIVFYALVISSRFIWGNISEQLSFEGSSLTTTWR
jgi:hypothetical protein